MRSSTALLSLELVLGGALTVAACASRSSSGAVPDGGGGSTDAGANDGSAGEGGPEAGPDGCATSASMPFCTGGASCEPGTECVYGDEAGGCATCSCAGSQDIGRYLCPAGKNGCPSQAPAAGSACLVENWSCFLPNDAGCTSLCGCLGNGTPGSAGVWSCNGCGGADGGAD